MPNLSKIGRTYRLTEFRGVSMAKEPRLSAPELTSDCVVTTASGDVYTIKRVTRKRSTGRTVRTTVTPVHARGTTFAMAYDTLMRNAGTIGNID